MAMTVHDKYKTLMNALIRKHKIRSVNYFIESVINIYFNEIN